MPLTGNGNASYIGNVTCIGCINASYITNTRLIKTTKNTKLDN